MNTTNPLRDWLQRILDGNPPDNIPSCDDPDIREAMEAVADAFGRGDIEAAQRAVIAMIRAVPAVSRLFPNGDPTPRRKWTAAELLRADFPEPNWVVPGLLPTGLTLLAGKPKLGKSWLALQLAVAVADGGEMWERRIPKGRVLFWAYEDSPRRLQTRLRLQGVEQGSEDVVFTVPDVLLVQEGREILRREAETFGLIIVDTLSRAAGAADQNEVGEMSILLGDLQRIASETDTAILVIDHHRKGAGIGDPILDVLGSTGKTAVADCIWSLYRERGKAEATLHVTGRDVEEAELALEWDATCHVWRCLGDAGDVRKGSAEADILDAVKELTAVGDVATVTTVAAHLGKTKPAVSRLLRELAARGVLQRSAGQGKQILYSLTGEDI